MTTRKAWVVAFAWTTLAAFWLSPEAFGQSESWRRPSNNSESDVESASERQVAQSDVVAASNDLPLAPPVAAEISFD